MPPQSQNIELEELRRRTRHSTAHVLAEAVLKLFPRAKPTIGPPTDDGFYYDFDIERPFAPDDLEKIEHLMTESIKADFSFIERTVTRLEAADLVHGNPYKQEILGGIPPDEPVAFCRHAEFDDLCRGGHLESTGQIKAFKLLSTSGAYWRGNERNPMLQRIYGTAFESQKALEDHLHLLEEARRRDHRVLGRELDLFSIHEEIGPGLIIWHPKGARVRSIFEDFWRQEHYRSGYDLVHSPHVGRSRLWETSGHLGYYKESMYAPIDMDGQEYYLKPMNCPFHIMYYKTGLRSYRDLPMRIGELGTVYRYERPGVLHGMLRVRGFTQDDAHIFCRPDQVEKEINGVLELTFRLLRTLGFSEFEVMLSTRPEKAVGEAERWELATESLRRTLAARDLQYQIDEGGGVFYGPKIDIHIRDAVGRLWQCTTIQFDFNLPERFELTYIGEDGQEHRPYMIHRALLGSLERFMGILIEHYAGAFPLWLAPVQAVLIPITDRHIEFANGVKAELESAGVRVQVDDSGDRMNAKIRNAQLQKVPYMLVVGDREQESGTVAVRMRSGEDLGAMAVGDVKRRLVEEVESRS